MSRRDEERRYTHDCNICPFFPSNSLQGSLPISSGSPLSLIQLGWEPVLSGKRPSMV